MEQDLFDNITTTTTITTKTSLSNPIHLSNQPVFKASAPGSFFLFGEHAVLKGGHAILFATDKRIQVKLTPRNDSKLRITSALGKLELDLADLEPSVVAPPFQFVLATLLDYRRTFNYGFDIAIDAGDFNDKWGLGSSAAVTVAMLGALHQWLEYKKSFPMPTLEMFFYNAKRIILSVQKVGSGADAAASIWGGMLFYRAKPMVIEHLPVSPPVFAIYSGAKVPTVEVIEWLSEKQKKYPKVFEKLNDAIDECANAARIALLDNDWTMVGELMKIQHGIQCTLGLNNGPIDHIIDLLDKENSVFGAKISGAGLGDCVIGIGEGPEKAFFDKQINHALYPGIIKVPMKQSFTGLTHD